MTTMERKERLKEIFGDTQAFYAEDAVLQKAVSYGRENTRLYEDEDALNLPPEKERAGEIRLVRAKTFETAMECRKEHPDKKITVLNFASAVSPGGGVRKGSSAQEESLCRCSTLYPTLDRRWLQEKYYGKNKNPYSNLHSDACIYSPGVVICKTDGDYPERLAREDFVTVDVISCAAPNLNTKSRHYDPRTWIIPNEAEQHEIHFRRGRHILKVAAANKADILVLGAFGCGAFENSARSVATAYKLLLEDYRSYFDEVIFAIYCHGKKEEENFKVFEEVLG